MVKIGFSDHNASIERAAEMLRRTTAHIPVIYDDLTKSLNSLKNGEIDCLVGGHDITTGDFLREIFRVIKPQGKVYSYSVLTKDGRTYYFADTGVNVSPNSEQLGELEELLQRELKPYIDCFEIARVGYKTEAGTMQIDAALNPDIAAKKGIADSQERNILVFPDLNAANIAYKLVQWLGGYSHAGPILLNVGYPVSDLSRGANTDEIYNTAKYLADLTQKRLNLRR